MNVRRLIAGFGLGLVYFGGLWLTSSRTAPVARAAPGLRRVGAVPGSAGWGRGFCAVSDPASARVQQCGGLGWALARPLVV